MHIVHYYPKKLPVKEYGGIERAIVWLIKGLKEFGHTVTFIGPEGSAIPHCVNICGPFDGIDIPSPQMLKKLLPRDADIVHFHSDDKFDGNYGIPAIVTVYGCRDNIHGLGRNYCFISDAQRQYWGYFQKPFIHIGLDPGEYIYREDKDDYFLFLSRVDWKVKGVDWAVKVAEKTGVRLIIAGNVHRRSFVSSYFRGYLKKKLSDKITYIGPVGGELKAMLLAKARALIFPTQWCEAFGIVTIEALTSGTPVITTHNGAMPEIIENGKHGFLCKDVDEMAEAVKKVDSIKPQDCLKRIDEKFNYKKMAEEYAKLYQSVLKSGNRLI
ncbi:MAG: hypothetical protein A3G39_05210 [Deltaproteobacteria bacterium RIFCSPLOWO2_12_FULL_43_16]|nr:MAG: hypothetical protein A2Z89_04055 [Deltaproteobacteria bacterium GWA2_43_19]OGQ09389.1 MAG: hypothetical protein A3D30_01090 [Deltaproteobacteria bacterium RIFCSPHIGHO2_02_FULL_43_33]OGQ58618.1 MAG: hypothetical protein A3G39_05210 [Deltaproteobacteria bacterium RIFCSPLOWO2_12_FULL_43_16]HBR16447.1 hypothetical protein [Deltaproteobacteria bacterium]